MNRAKRVVFAGGAWIDGAREILEDLVSIHGEDAQAFSVCEVFTNAPATVAASGVAAWHFYINGKAVRVGAGAVDDVDVKIEADYEESLPNARLIYTADSAASQPTELPPSSVGTVRGDFSKAPSYLLALHNRLAAITR